MMKLILLIVSVGVIGTAGYFLFLKEKTLPAYLGVHESVEMNADTRSALFAYDAIRAAARADDLEALISLAVFAKPEDTRGVRQLADEKVDITASDGFNLQSKLFMPFPPFGEPREVGQLMLMKVSENALWFAQSFRTETEQRNLYEYIVYRVPYTHDAGSVKIIGPKSRLGYDTFAKSSSDSEDVSDTVILKKVEELAQKNP